MENLEIIFFLLLSAVLLVGIAQKINVPYPIILILGGAAISFIPGIDNIYFDPNLVLMIFLPPILYYSAFGISFREFQQELEKYFFSCPRIGSINHHCYRNDFQVAIPPIPMGACICFWSHYIAS